MLYLWRCATNLKVVGSIPDWVIQILHCVHPSGHTMALGLTQPPTEMSTRSSKGGRCVGLTTFLSSCAKCLYSLGAWTSYNPKGLSGLVRGELYLYRRLCHQPSFHSRLYLEIVFKICGHWKLASALRTDDRRSVPDPTTFRRQDCSPRRNISNINTERGT